MDPHSLKVSRIAAKQLLTLAHAMKLLHLANTFKLANFIQDNQLELAHQAHSEVLRETAVWARIP